MEFFNDMMAWENDKLDNAGIVRLFAGLVRTGLAWSLQGMYGRQAQELISAGYISSDGEILVDLEEE